MIKQFKTIKPIYAKNNLWSTFDIPVGTILQQISDTKNLINPIKGIVVELNNQAIGIPYEYLVPNYEYKTTILLFHGFNSAPENKKAIIKQWIIDNNLTDKIDLIAPQLNYNPNEAIKQIGNIIQEYYGNIIVIGTSLGGFYLFCPKCILSVFKNNKGIMWFFASLNRNFLNSVMFVIVFLGGESPLLKNIQKD